MAFKLSKAEEAHRQNLIDELRERAEEVKDVDSLAAYNSTLAKVKIFTESVTDRLREEYDEKSEKWLESDRASEVDEFISEWEMMDLEDAEMPEMDEAFSVMHADDLENLPDSV